MHIHLGAHWCRELIERTGNLRCQCLMRGVLRNPEYLQDSLLSALEQINSSDEKAILRVFVDRGQRFDLLEKLRSANFSRSESLDEWIQRTIGSAHYCVTVNGITKWNERLHCDLAENVIRPLTAELGGLFSGVDSYAFIANHDYTPFGIHEDRDDSLIFHLGPRTKEVWICEREKYIELNGDDSRSFDFDSFSHQAIHHILEPGDLLYIPRGDFHVFRNNGFSSFLGFILYPATHLSIMRDGLEYYMQEHGDAELSFFDEGNLERQAAQVWDSTLGSDPDTAVSALKSAMHKSKLLLRSNAYSIHKPSLFVEPWDVRSAVLSNPRPFPIFAIEEGNVITLFVRGRSLRLRNHESISALVRFINSHEGFTYDDLVAILSVGFDSQACSFLISKLVQFRGLHVESPASDQWRSPVKVATALE